jgi:hypothetical protein
MIGSPRQSNEAAGSCPGEPTYLTLKSLARYSSCSPRWLRSRLVDSHHPLPHFRIGGKILVKRGDFDEWIARHQVVRRAAEINDIVDSVLTQLHRS